MANEAHKEPTMEEILSSIRKIISDDDVAAPAEVERVVEDQLKADDVLQSADNDDFEALTTGSASEDLSLDDDVFGDLEIDDAEEVELTDQSTSFEDLVANSHAKTTEPVADFAEQIAQPEIRTEPDMASRKYDQTVLTDDNTADAAAGALGKLISQMDMGSDNTIEGLVRAMLKPMIKEWLDSNLPGIVETKVEAEVQRIARMAR